MARLPRYNLPGQPQHVILRGNNRCIIFAAEEDYRFFLDCLQDAADRHGCAITCLCADDKSCPSTDDASARGEYW